MNLRQLEVFIAVVECGKITRAAEKLFVAQPSVSQTIADLEHQYGVMLFQRLNKKLYLTEIGRTLYIQAKSAVKNFEEMHNFLIDAGAVSSIKIGATVTVGNCLLSKILTAFNGHGVNYEKLIVDNTESIIEKLLDGRLDLAIIEGKADNENLNVEILCDDEIVFVAKKGYKFDGTSIENFIVREAGSGTREMTLEKIKKVGIKIRNLWEISSTEAIKDLLTLGNCATAISKRIVISELTCGKLEMFMTNKIIRKFYLVHHKDKKMTPLLTDFIKVCKSKIFLQI